MEFNAIMETWTSLIYWFRSWPKIPKIGQNESWIYYHTVKKAEENENKEMQSDFQAGMIALKDELKQYIDVKVNSIVSKLDEIEKKKETLQSPTGRKSQRKKEEKE